MHTNLSALASLVIKERALLVVERICTCYYLEVGSSDLTIKGLSRVLNISARTLNRVIPRLLSQGILVKEETEDSSTTTLKVQEPQHWRLSRSTRIR